MRSRRYNAQNYTPPQPERVELYISCKGLANLDALSKSDPQVRLYTQQNGRWQLFGKTETRKDNLNPIFRVTFILDFVFEIPHYLRFEVVDIDGPDAFETIGIAETTLSAIMGSRGQTVTYDLAWKNIRNRGKITIKGEQFAESQNMVKMQWTGVKLMNTDGPRDKSDPFLRIFKKRFTGEWLQVHQTEVKMNDLNPEWKPIEIGDAKLSKNYYEPIRIECWDYEKSGDYQFIGHCEATLNQLRSGDDMFELQNYKVRTRPGYLRLTHFSLQQYSHQNQYSQGQDFDRYNPQTPSNHYNNPPIRNTPSHEVPRYPSNYDYPSQPTRIYPSKPSSSIQKPPSRQFQDVPVQSFEDDILTRRPNRPGTQKPTPPQQQYQQDFRLGDLKVEESQYIAKPTQPSSNQYSSDVPEFSYKDLINNQYQYQDTPKPQPTPNRDQYPSPQQDYNLKDLINNQYQYQDTPKPKPSPPKQPQQQYQKDFNIGDLKIDESQYVPQPKPSANQDVPEYNFKDLLNNQHQYDDTPRPQPSTTRDQYPAPQQDYNLKDLINNQYQYQDNSRPTQPQKDWSLDDVQIDQSQYIPKPKPQPQYPINQNQPIQRPTPQQAPKPTFLDYLRTGTTLNTVVAVDFSSSNGPLSSPTSLHAVLQDGSMNEYQKAIYCVCQILLNYDYDQQTAMLGFGAIPNFPNLKSRTASDCFPMTGSFDQQQATGIQGVMDIYAHALQNIELSGPTHFAPILRETMGVCEANKKANIEVYNILLIVTNGKVNDMEETKDLIVKAAALPLSVIIVGVGNGDFTNMEILDGDYGLINSKGEKAKRDLVQFVAFREHSDMNSLGQAVLQEVPDQLVEYMSLVGKMPGGFMGPM